jgi:MFS family permease
MPVEGGRLLLESRSGAGGNRALILCSGVRAFVLGHWGDTHGRKNVLVLCMFMMGVSTCAVALLPGVCAALRALTGLLDEAGGDLGEVAG